MLSLQRDFGVDENARLEKMKESSTFLIDPYFENVDCNKLDGLTTAFLETAEKDKNQLGSRVQILNEKMGRLKEKFISLKDACMVN